MVWYGFGVIAFVPLMFALVLTQVTPGSKVGPITGAVLAASTIATVAVAAAVVAWH